MSKRLFVEPLHVITEACAEVSAVAFEELDGSYEGWTKVTLQIVYPKPQEHTELLIAHLIEQLCEIPDDERTVELIAKN